MSSTRGRFVYLGELRISEIIFLILPLIIVILSSTPLHAEDRTRTVIGAVEEVVVFPWEVKLPARIDTGELLRDIEVPFWERMLLMAAESTDMMGLGYLGVDLVIDKNDGPFLLELNAQPGLQIQIANQKGLLERLELIGRAPKEIFVSPEKRVAWATQNFAEPSS